MPNVEQVLHGLLLYSLNAFAFDDRSASPGNQNSFILKKSSMLEINV